MSLSWIQNISNKTLTRQPSVIFSCYGQSNAAPSKGQQGPSGPGTVSRAWPAVLRVLDSLPAGQQHLTSIILHPQMQPAFERQTWIDDSSLKIEGWVHSRMELSPVTPAQQLQQARVLTAECGTHLYLWEARQ